MDALQGAGLRPSAIVPTVDFDGEGVQHGFLRLPYSRDDSAWGSVMIPVTVARRGDGPTLLATGGVHGDEYEGPIALFDLARRIEAEEVTGRVIIIPALNYPAFRAGTRTSPYDRGNLNRLFPGRPDGTVTEKIADFVERYLLPLSDYVLDFHSGGRTLEFLPFAAAHVLASKEQEARCFAAVEAFGAPYSMRMREIDPAGMLDTAAEALGKVFVTTELGGGGTGGPATIEIARRGLTNVLRHAGILPGTPEAGETRWLEMPSDDCFLFSEQEGLVEPCKRLGEPVKAGDSLARIYPTNRTGAAPAEYRARMDGIVVARHFPGLCQSGDCIAVLAAPL